MKKVSFIVDKVHQKNKIFDGQGKIGSFDKYIALKNFFQQEGFDIATNDINTPEDSDIVLYFDMPNKLPKLEDKYKSYLLALESSIIKPENFDTEKHKYFNKIFTWNDDIVDNIKYIKINYAFDFPNKIYKNINREKLCCLIVSNKTSKLPNELYSERKKLIEWFEKNHIEDFDLYGFGWDSFRFNGNKLIRGLNKIPFLNQLIYKLFIVKYKVYKGTVEDKFETMKKYKFSIAYENVKDENGYITEKIFDVFIAGCVPIYWGAKNIKEYIPEDCFIDRRKFDSNEALYDFISNLSDDKYKKYLDNIEQYLNSKQAEQFNINTFSKRIVNNSISKENNDKQR